MDEELIADFLNKHSEVPKEDLVKFVQKIQNAELNKYKDFLRSIGVGCSVCKFNANLNPKGHCNGADWDELPFCKDYWVGDGEW